MRIIAWIKRNKLTVFLLVVVLYLLFKLNPTPLNFNLEKRSSLGYSAPNYSPIQPESAPNLNIKDRIVVKESNLSLLVKNVTEVKNQIIKKAEDLGGYMVNSSLENPQDTATATVIVRIPVSKLNEALSYFRTLSIKVISENIQGQDVTDQYVDIEERMATLLKTKTKFEDIMNKATQIEDILNVQRELINLESQIEALKGQKDFLTKNAQASKITIYLSTDELSLPYASSDTFRPAVIFKQAVRSLIANLRKFGTWIIWIFVYSIIWIPIVLVVYFIRRRRVRLN